MLLAWQLPSLSDSIVYVSIMNFHKIFDRTLVSSQNGNERENDKCSQRTNSITVKR